MLEDEDTSHLDDGCGCSSTDPEVCSGRYLDEDACQCACHHKEEG